MTLLAEELIEGRPLACRLWLVGWVIGWCVWAGEPREVGPATVVHELVR